MSSSGHKSRNRRPRVVKQRADRSDAILNAAASQLDQKFNEMISTAEGAARGPPRHALVFTRTSSAITSENARAQLVADATRTYNAVQPRVDGRNRTPTYILQERQAFKPMAGATTAYGGATELVANAVQSIPDGADVLIFIRSFTGLTTNYGTFRMFLQELRDDKEFNLNVFIWSRLSSEYKNSALTPFIQRFQPIAEGTLGHGLFLPVQDLIDRVQNEIVDDFYNFCDHIERIKAGGQDPEASLRYRNRILDEEVINYEMAIVENRMNAFNV